MGIYYVGATSCFLERFPCFIRDASKIYGASAGALMASVLSVGVPLGELVPARPNFMQKCVILTLHRSSVNVPGILKEVKEII